MKRYSRITRGVGGLLAALVCAVALFGCAGDTTNNNVIPPPTTGSLKVEVNPGDATVVVTGPNSYTTSFTSNQMLGDLAPGQYTATGTRPGYYDATSSINVVVGLTSSIQLNLKATDIISQAPRAVYRDGDGNLIPLDSSSLQPDQVVFYAWLQNQAGGIDPAKLNLPIVSNPDEKTETAPSLTQNLAAAYVGFKDATGVVRPVIGADVRWTILDSTDRMIFGTSDDNAIARDYPYYGIDNKQADTRTNNSSLTAERFPFIATEYPLYNQTGIGSPFVDGFTWVTLFSPDPKAVATIVAVASINGEEIGKQVLTKNFAPAPKIEVTKTVDADILNLDVGDTVTWTVTVKNVGTGEATTVSLSDFLASGAGASYTLGSLPSGSTPVGDGFTYTFGPLAAPGTPAPPQTAQLLGNAQSFGVLAKETVTNSSTAANPTVVSGDVGVSAGSAVTGFPTGIVLNGTIHNNDAAAQAAQTALTAAYVALGDVAARPCTGPVNQALTGTFKPGVYCYDSSVAMGTSLTLDAEGDPNAEFVFRIATTLDTPAGATVTLINGANPCNVYWRVGSSATLLTDNFFVGNILAQESITVGTGTSISGRALARNASVTLNTNAINAPLNCVVAPAVEKTLTFTATVTQPGTYCNGIQVTGTTPSTPVAGINDQACFTAVRSNLSIVKDFVDDDNTTSLGKDKTVAANVPAKLRVRVINSGTGDATGVSVNDVLTSGIPATTPYKIVSVSSGTVNGSNNGFTTDINTVAAGTTTTVLFTVAASADGKYCDTATVTADAGTTIGIDKDSACLTVATPKLTIKKTDAPGSVLPGATYTSTIVVKNEGAAVARNVVISDLLGFNSAADVQAIYVSSSLNGAAGTLTNNTVTANSVVTLEPNETITFTVVSRIPLGAVAGTYCDTATVTSSNAVTGQTEPVCVVVPAFSALQTQLIDLNDPVAVGSNVAYSAVLYVESLSNEGVKNNEVKYSFGLDSPTKIGQAGVFQVTSTKVYLDTEPVRDPVTGLVVSGPTTSATAVLLTEGTDYTVDDNTPGLQVITMTPATTVLQPNTALYVEHVVLVPSGTPTNKLYTTSYIWKSKGVTSGNIYEASSSEPTSVLP